MSLSPSADLKKLEVLNISDDIRSHFIFLCVLLLSPSLLLIHIFLFIIEQNHVLS